MHIGIPWSLAVAHGVAIAIAFLVITYLHVVLGELAPKAVALQRAENVALLFLPPLLAFASVTRPLVVAMRALAPRASSSSCMCRRCRPSRASTRSRNSTCWSRRPRRRA